jgi:hypothetical protein
MSDAYGFIRASLLRKFSRHLYSTPEVLERLEECGKLTDGEKVMPLRRALESIELPLPLRHTVLALVQSFKPKVILNFVKETEPHRQFQALRLATKNLLDVSLDHFGMVHFDERVRRAVQQMRPDMLIAENVTAMREMREITQKRIIYSEGPEVKHAANRQYMQSQFLSAKVARICNHKCIAWNSCAERNGGEPCNLTSPAPLKKRI